MAVLRRGSNGGLEVSGGRILASGQPAIYGLAGSVISVSGGRVQSASAAAVAIAQDSVLTMTDSTVSGGPGGGSQWGVRLDNNSVQAALSGGTVHGGVRASGSLGQPAAYVQAALGGTVTVNGGVFAYSTAALDVSGGTFSGGQSAVGLRIFDALAVGGTTAGLRGGFNLFPAVAVPEPATWLLMGLALPGLWAAARRRRPA